MVPNAASVAPLFRQEPCRSVVVHSTASGSGRQPHRGEDRSMPPPPAKPTGDSNKIRDIFELRKQVADLEFKLYDQTELGRQQADACLEAKSALSKGVAEHEKEREQHKADKKRWDEKLQKATKAAADARNVAAAAEAERDRLSQKLDLLVSNDAKRKRIDDQKKENYDEIMKKLKIDFCEKIDAAAEEITASDDHGEAQSEAFKQQ